MPGEPASIGQPGSASSLAAKVLAWAARVGADPRESSDVALQRQLLILLSVGTLPMTALWSAIYLAAGAPLAAAVPAIYTVVAPINTLIFSWTRNLRVYRFSQLLMTWCCHGSRRSASVASGNSSAVIIWAALCPLISLLVEDLQGNHVVDRGLRCAADRAARSFSLTCRLPGCRTSSSPGSSCSTWGS